MKLILTFLTLILFGTGNHNPDPPEAVQNTLRKYQEANSMTYDIEYMWKSFDSEKPWYLNTSVSIEKVKEDTLFKAKLSYARKDSFSDILKVYIPPEVLLIDHKEKEVTRYNASEIGTWPITGSSDGSVLNSFFLNARGLLKALSNEENEVVYRDSIEYVVVEVGFPDNGDFTERVLTFYFNKENLTIDRVISSIRYFDQLQKNDWIFANIVFDNVPEAYFEDLISPYMKEYEIEDYEEPDESYYNLMEVGEIAPNLTGNIFPDYDSEVKLKLDKITILDFWYTSCIPCIKAVPELNKIKEKYGDTIDVLGVNPFENTQKDEERINKFLNRTPMDYDIFMAKEIPEEFNIKIYPSIYVLDKDSRVLFTHLGFNEELFDILDGVIQENIE